jgi:hypothetical protein
MYNLNLQEPERIGLRFQLRALLCELRPDKNDPLTTNFIRLTASGIFDRCDYTV